MNRTDLLIAAAALFAVAAFAHGGGLVLNEYNAVADGTFLTAGSGATAYKGSDYGGIRAATAGAGNSALTGNARDGRIKGNGGNWVELVVTEDHTDLRGWSLQWSNQDAVPDAGTITFNTNPIWSNVRSGTIITVIEDGLQTPVYDDGTTGAPINLDTNPSFNPAHNDWWMNFDVDDVTYLHQDGFKVDNDNWQMTIKNAAGQIVSGPIGESVAGWGGGGINSQEIGANVADPSSSNTNSNFSDNDYSTLGEPNRYMQNTKQQDFSALRTWWTNRKGGDANVDGKVDVADLGILATNWQTLAAADWFAGDFTADGKVDVADLGILATNWQSGVGGPTFAEAMAAYGLNLPEPSSLALIGVGAMLIRRRRNA